LVIKERPGHYIMNERVKITMRWAKVNGFSAAIKVFFGYYPAKKAAGLDPSTRCDLKSRCA